MTTKVLTAIAVQNFQNEDARRNLVDIIKATLPHGPDEFVSIRYARDEHTLSPAGRIVDALSAQHGPDTIVVWAVVKPRRRPKTASIHWGNDGI